MATTTLEDLQILRLPEVMHFTGLRRTSIYQMMADGIFPRSVKLGPRSMGWRAGDLRAWLEGRISG